MSTLREAAQQALEALTNCASEYGHRCNRCDSEVDEGGKVVSALRAALEQPEQEPVAWLYRDHNGQMRLNEIQPRPYFAFPVYTHPPRREWQGLTEEEINKLRHLIDWTSDWSYNNFARAIEAALKEKNA